MAKLIRTFDGFSEQEDKYAEILRDILVRFVALILHSFMPYQALRKAQAAAAAQEADALRQEMSEQAEVVVELQEHVRTCFVWNDFIALFSD